MNSFGNKNTEMQVRAQRERAQRDPLTTAMRNSDLRPAGMRPERARPEGARAGVVNRTRRVVREQALQMQQQRRTSRGLWAPLAIVSVLLMVICYAFWGVLDAYELTPNGVPDASDQLMILLLWSLPVTALVLGVVWVKRGRGRAGSEGEVQP